MTGQEPPTVPPTAKEYQRHGLPWFDYYDDQAKALEGSNILAGLKSVIQMGHDQGQVPLPENESVKTDRVINLGAKRPKDQVREGDF
jgi:hypothetical protein